MRILCSLRIRYVLNPTTTDPQTHTAWRKPAQLVQQSYSCWSTHRHKSIVLKSWKYILIIKKIIKNKTRTHNFGGLVQVKLDLNSSALDIKASGWHHYHSNHLKMKVFPLGIDTTDSLTRHDDIDPEMNFFFFLSVNSQWYKYQVLSHPKLMQVVLLVRLALDLNSDTLISPILGLYTHTHIIYNYTLPVTYPSFRNTK